MYEELENVDGVPTVMENLEILWNFKKAISKPGKVMETNQILKSCGYLCSRYAFLLVMLSFKIFNLQEIALETFSRHTGRNMFRCVGCSQTSINILIIFVMLLMTFTVCLDICVFKSLFFNQK